MTRATVVLAAALLVGCGDGDSSGAGGSKAGATLSAEEMADALRQQASADPDEMRRAVEAAAAEASKQMGGNVADVAAKAKALSERSLTAADVERYLAAVEKVRALGTKPEGLADVLADHGLTVPEWGVLSGRIAAARIASKMPSDKLDAKVLGDVEAVRPFLDRLFPPRRGN